MWFRKRKEKDCRLTREQALDLLRLHERTKLPPGIQMGWYFDFSTEQFFHFRGFCSVAKVNRETGEVSVELLYPR